MAISRGRMARSISCLYPKDYPIGEFAKGCDPAVMERKTFEVATKMGGGPFLSPSFVFSRKKPVGKRAGVTYMKKTRARLIDGEQGLFHCTTAGRVSRSRPTSPPARTSHAVLTR